MAKKLILILLMSLSIPAMATVTVGGYVPFGLSAQTEEDGRTGVFNLDPMIALNYSMPTLWGHFFLPEAGFVFHTGLADGYSKTTSFILLDFGMPFLSQFMFRYGVGTFMTKISGDGAAVVLNNGGSTATFYRPGTSQTSWNSTIDLGAEYAFRPHYSLRFETYIFAPLSSEERDISYSFALTYFL